jgi:hypothetical protein
MSWRSPVVKRIVQLRRGHEGPEGEYSSTLSLTSALYEGGWSTPFRGCFTPQKAPVPFVGGSQGRSGLVRKISPPAGVDPRSVQPVASRHTDGAVPAHTVLCLTRLMFVGRGKKFLVRLLIWAANFLSAFTVFLKSLRLMKLIFSSKRGHNHFLPNPKIRNMPCLIGHYLLSIYW